jgi:hypothetical protein
LLGRIGTSMFAVFENLLQILHRRWRSHRATVVFGSYLEVVAGPSIVAILTAGEAVFLPTQDCVSNHECEPLALYP